MHFICLVNAVFGYVHILMLLAAVKQLGTHSIVIVVLWYVISSPKQFKPSNRLWPMLLSLLVNIIALNEWKCACYIRFLTCNSALSRLRTN